MRNFRINNKKGKYVRLLSLFLQIQFNKFSFDIKVSNPNSYYFINV